MKFVIAAKRRLIPSIFGFPMAEVARLVDPWTAHENLVSEVFGEVTERWSESVLPTHINRALLELMAILPRVDFKSRMTESFDNRVVVHENHWPIQHRNSRLCTDVGH